MKTRSESHRLVKALVAAAFLLVTIGVSAATREVANRRQTDPRFEELAALVTEKMAEYRVPGVAFGIVKDGRVQSRGFGVTNVDNPQPVTSDTIFTVASISKTLVATALMRLVEGGQLDLEAPVRSYLPDFKVQDETATRGRSDLESHDAHAGLGRATGRTGSRSPFPRRLHGIHGGFAAACSVRSCLELQQRRLCSLGSGDRSRYRQIDTRSASGRRH